VSTGRNLLFGGTLNQELYVNYTTLEQSIIVPSKDRRCNLELLLILIVVNIRERLAKNAYRRIESLDKSIPVLYGVSLSAGLYYN
jgi:hypothetical protein